MPWLFRLSRRGAFVPPAKPALLPLRPRPRPRTRSQSPWRWSSTTPDYQTVEIPCGSAGSIAISLHNISEQTATTPLLIYLPPFPSPTPSPDALPPLLQPYPTAIIHYRWSASPSPAPTPVPFAPDDNYGDYSDADDADLTAPLATTPLCWPTPVHDVAFAYHWLSTNLAPPGLTRRDILVLSSHLGASLATSLALTESRPHLPFAVRGLAVLNGIYSWPMFLPDHRAHRKSPPRSRAASAAAARRALLAHAAEEEEDPEQRGTVLSGSTVSYQGCDQLARFAALMPGLFGYRPARLFDVFASPALMFQTPGINVPSSFTRSDNLASQIDWLASVSTGSSASSSPISPPTPPAPPRRAALIFPPRSSTLKIPDTLLMYSRPPHSQPQAAASSSSSSSRPSRRKKSSTPRPLKPWGNTFETQALEFAALMRRSVEKLEVKERREWDFDFDEDDDLPEKRVRVLGVDDADDPAWGIDRGTAARTVASWLRERCGY